MLKYRKHIRYKDFDYSSPGDYFVTICSRNFKHIFSKIKEANVCLTEIGKIIEYAWFKLPYRYPSIKLGVFVIMPNHFHGIITIKPQSKDINLSTVVQQFKGISTRKVNRKFYQNKYTVKHTSIWQDNFYEQILEDEFHYYFVEEYILSNPINWEKDKLYKAGII